MMISFIFTTTIIIFFIILLIYITVLYIGDLKTGKDKFIKKTFRWIKNIIDLMFGLG